MKKVLVILFTLVGIGLAAERMVLGEMFTSTTCGPCVSGNTTVDGILSTSGSYLAVVRYHVWWPYQPGNDPAYNYNKSENSSRVGVYGINSVPSFVVDGTVSSSWQSDVSSRHGVESPFVMKLYRNFSSSAYNAQQGIGTVMAEIKNEENTTYEYKVYCALTESDFQYTGQNGDPEHDQVMIDMLPYAFGTTLKVGPLETKQVAFDFAVDDTIPFLELYTLEPTGETHIVDAKNCELVCWYQNATTKEVFQAAKIAVTGSKLLTVENVKLVDASGDGILSPDEEVYVHLKVANGSSSSMTKIHVFVSVDNKNVSVEKGMAEIAQIPAKGSVELTGQELVLKIGSSYDGSDLNVSCYAGSLDGSLGYAVQKWGGVDEAERNAAMLSLPSVARVASTIKLSPATNLKGNCTVTLYDPSGRSVTALYRGPSSGLTKLTLPSEARGLCFIRIETSERNQTYKLVLLD